MPQRQISVVISLPMIVQLGKTLLLLKRSADYALGVVYHVKQQHFNPHPTSRPGATSWMILYPLIPHYSCTWIGRKTPWKNPRNLPWKGKELRAIPTSI